MCPPSTAVTNHPDLKKSKLTSATRYPSLMFPVFKKLPLCIHESNAPHLKSKIRLAGVGIYRWTTSQCNSPNGFSHTYNLHTLKHPVGTLKPKHPFWNQRTSLSQDMCLEKIIDSCWRRSEALRENFFSIHDSCTTDWRTPSWFFLFFFRSSRKNMFTRSKIGLKLLLKSLVSSFVFQSPPLHTYIYAAWPLPTAHRWNVAFLVNGRQKRKKIGRGRE